MLGLLWHQPARTGRYAVTPLRPPFLCRLSCAVMEAPPPATPPPVLTPRRPRQRPGDGVHPGSATPRRRLCGKTPPKPAVAELAPPDASARGPAAGAAPAPAVAALGPPEASARGPSAAAAEGAPVGPAEASAPRPLVDIALPEVDGDWWSRQYFLDQAVYLRRRYAVTRFTNFVSQKVRVTHAEELGALRTAAARSKRAMAMAREAIAGEQKQSLLTEWAREKTVIEQVICGAYFLRGSLQGSDGPSCRMLTHDGA